jgi:hypothetical protein
MLDDGILLLASGKEEPSPVVLGGKLSFAKKSCGKVRNLGSLRMA